MARPTKQASNFIDVEVAANQLVETIMQQRSVIDTAIQQLKNARTELERLEMPPPQGFGGLTAFLTTKVAENPNNLAWETSAARLQETLTEFQAEKQRVIDMITAIEAV